MHHFQVLITLDFDKIVSTKKAFVAMYFVNSKMYFKIRLWRDIQDLFDYHDSKALFGVHVNSYLINDTNNFCNFQILDSNILGIRFHK